MSMSHSLINRLVIEAKKSTMPYQLAAVIIKGKHMIGTPKINNSRMFCRGHRCSSHHAEVSAMRSLCGQKLSWTEDKGWCHAKVAEWEKET